MPKYKPKTNRNRQKTKRHGIAAEQSSLTPCPLPLGEGESFPDFPQAPGKFCRLRDSVVSPENIFAMKINLDVLTRKGIIPVMAIVSLATLSASGGEAYLASIGPPPLRFEYVDNNNALFLSELALPQPKPVVQPPMPPPQPEAKAETNSVTGGIAPGAENGVPIFPGPAKNAPGFLSPASDMLSITPQMINEYFKPSRAEGDAEPGPYQHGQSIFVPAELGFVPPTPESRAIYNSK